MNSSPRATGRLRGSPDRPPPEWSDQADKRKTWLRSRASDFDQLDSLLARATDHHGPRVAKRVHVLQEPHAAGVQTLNPGIQISDGQGEMVVEVPARRRERLLALTHVPRQPYVAEGNTARRFSEHTVRVQ